MEENHLILQGLKDKPVLQELKNNPTLKKYLVFHKFFVVPFHLKSLKPFIVHSRIPLTSSLILIDFIELVCYSA